MFSYTDEKELDRLQSKSNETTLSEQELVKLLDLYARYRVEVKKQLRTLRGG